MSASAPEACEVVAATPSARPKDPAGSNRQPSGTVSASAPAPSAAAPVQSGATSAQSGAAAVTDPGAMSAVDLATELLAAGRRLVIVGVTREGRRFRPSDWAERLAGVMSQYRPGKAGKAAAQPSHLGYSPLVVPSEDGGDKCVIVDPRLRQVEPLAWMFALNFARDNGLKVETR